MVREKRKLEIVPERSTSTRVYLDGKEVNNLRAYKIEQRAGQMPKVTLEFNGWFFKYKLNEPYDLLPKKPNIFKRSWENFKIFCSNIPLRYKDWKARRKGEII